MRNNAVARNWPQVTLRNCRFAPNWAVLWRSQILCKTPCTTFLLLKIGPKSHCATVVFLEMGDISQKAKTCPKHRAQQCCCSQLAPSQTAYLWFWSKLCRIVRKLKPVRTCVRSCPVNQFDAFCEQAKTCQKHRAQISCSSILASSHTVQLSFCLKLARIVTKLTPVRNCARNCPVNKNWWLLLKS